MKITSRQLFILVALSSLLSFSAAAGEISLEAGRPAPSVAAFLQSNPGSAEALSQMMGEAENFGTPGAYLGQLLIQATPASTADGQAPNLAASVAAVALAARPEEGELVAVAPLIGTDAARKFRPLGDAFERVAASAEGRGLLDAARGLDLAGSPESLARNLSGFYDKLVDAAGVTRMPKPAAKPVMPEPQAIEELPPANAVLIPAGRAVSDYLSAGDAVEIASKSNGLNVGQAFFAASKRVVIESIEADTGKTMVVNERGLKYQTNILFLTFAERPIIQEKSQVLRARLTAKPKKK